jgi:Tat protein translocase TatB subunit
MFGTLGGPELFLIMVVALIVFGPRKLPEIGKSMGKMMAEFRKASLEFRQTIETEVEAEKIRDAARIEMPRLDAPPTAPAAPASTPAASSNPGHESLTLPGAGEAIHAGSTQEPAPIEPATVSRNVASTPIEPK